MPTGLPVSRLISVEVDLTPLAAQFINFDTLLIMGDSEVIDVQQRIRLYEDLTSVANDFGTSAPEYLAAQIFFAQIPQPSSLYIGRWAQANTHGQLRGGVLASGAQAMSNFTPITNGGFHISIDGSASTNITGLNFSTDTNLNQVAAAIQAAIVAAAVNAGFTGATVTWDAQNEIFRIKSGTTGASSSVSVLTAPTSGTDISALIGGTLATGAVVVNGIGAESAVAAVTIMDGLATSWYGLAFASTHIVDADHQAIANFIQGAGNPHVYGITTTEAAALDPNNSADIGSVLRPLDLTRTFIQYSQNPYAVASFFGRAFTVNFAMSLSTITLMYKVEPSVAFENLTASQATALQNKRINVYVAYNNNTAIIQYGVMSGQAYFDEIHGLDWLANQVQTDVFNLLFTTPTKVPQTDAGANQIVATIKSAMQAGVNNGLIAAGQWNSAGFGQLKQGDFLSTGFYIFAPPVATQAQADREARKSVPIQVAVKLAGAVHTVDIQINVNR